LPLAKKRIGPPKINRFSPNEEGEIKNRKALKTYGLRQENTWGKYHPATVRKKGGRGTRRHKEKILRADLQVKDEKKK